MTVRYYTAGRDTLARIDLDPTNRAAETLRDDGWHDRVSLLDMIFTGDNLGWDEIPADEAAQIATRRGTIGLDAATVGDPPATSTVLSSQAYNPHGQEVPADDPTATRIEMLVRTVDGTEEKRTLQR